MPARSSRRGRCYRTWCWGTRGLQASSRYWAQPQAQAWPQLHLRPLHQFRPLTLYRSDSNPDRGAQGRWPHWGGPCPLRALCPWNQNVPPTSTWSLLWGSVDDLPFLHRGKAMVSLFGFVILLQIFNHHDQNDKSILLIVTLTFETFDSVKLSAWWNHDSGWSNWKISQNNIRSTSLFPVVQSFWQFTCWKNGKR